MYSSLPAEGHMIWLQRFLDGIEGDEHQLLGRFFSLLDDNGWVVDGKVELARLLVELHKVLFVGLYLPNIQMITTKFMMPLTTCRGICHQQRKDFVT